ncbi:MAG: hypothetical protein NZ843_05050 [Fimbriimonadales bacterium]|nr:hypothetical protein [Fimbriimonadales bacterium]
MTRLVGFGIHYLKTQKTSKNGQVSRGIFAGCPKHRWRPSHRTPLPPLFLGALGGVLALYMLSAEVLKRWFYRNHAHA